MITSTLWATAKAACLGPNLLWRRRYWAERELLLIGLMTQASSQSTARKALLPFVGFPLLRLPALIAFPGQTPAHEAKWAAVGKSAMVSPISESIMLAEVREIAGSVTSKFRRA